MTAALITLAFIALAVIAVVGWCVAGEWRAAALRAEQFAKDCRAENRDLREQAAGREDVLRSWRAWAGRLERHIHDTRDYETWAAMVAERDAAVDAAAERESARLDEELFELLNEEGT